jgi:hypothetical protein
VDLVDNSHDELNLLSKLEPGDRRTAISVPLFKYLRMQALPKFRHTVSLHSHQKSLNGHQHGKPRSDLRSRRVSRQLVVGCGGSADEVLRRSGTSVSFKLTDSGAVACRLVL